MFEAKINSAETNQFVAEVMQQIHVNLIAEEKAVVDGPKTLETPQKLRELEVTRAILERNYFKMHKPDFIAGVKTLQGIRDAYKKRCAAYLNLTHPLIQKLIYQNLECSLGIFRFYILLDEYQKAQDGLFRNYPEVVLSEEMLYLVLERAEATYVGEIVDRLNVLTEDFNGNFSFAAKEGTGQAIFLSFAAFIRQFVTHEDYTKYLDSIEKRIMFAQYKGTLTEGLCAVFVKEGKGMWSGKNTPVIMRLLEALEVCTISGSRKLSVLESLTPRGIPQLTLYELLKKGTREDLILHLQIVPLVLVLLDEYRYGDCVKYLISLDATISLERARENLSRVERLVLKKYLHNGPKDPSSTPYGALPGRHFAAAAPGSDVDQSGASDDEEEGVSENDVLASTLSSLSLSDNPRDPEDTSSGASMKFS